MDNISQFSYKNLASKPEFNFSCKFTTQESIGDNNLNTYDDSLYANINIGCKYMDETTFCNEYSRTNKFSFLSLNVQSLNAKFTDLQETIDNFILNKCSPDVLLLQEIWQIQNVNTFSLNSYSMLNFKTRSNNVQGGGVGIFFKNGLRYNILPELSIFIDRVIETIFAELWITKNKKVIIASIYRPSVNHPTLNSSEQYHQFMELFANTLNNFLESKTPVYLFGDLNLDVLRYNTIYQVTDYVDLLFSHGFLQIVCILRVVPPTQRL